VVHGRRRVGKTELIEQVFRERNLLKFEGVEGQDEAYQRRVFMRQLAEYAGDVAIASIEFGSWLEVFEYLVRFVSNGTWTLFFGELQWLSCYKETLVAELKHVWDNKFRRDKNLLLVLCGSSPSFMIGKVLESKALHNRSMHELPLAEFSLAETREFFGAHRGQQEIMDAYLSVGGIPEYLKYLTHDSSVFLSLCRNSFVSGAFFSAERDRVFVSSLARNVHYGGIIDFLSQRRYTTRTEIAAHLKIDPGGNLSDLLTDLALCGFIQHYTPFNMSEKAKVMRYAIQDKYLQFYYLCEVKYLRGPAPRSTADEFERKLMRFPNWEHESIHKVLISAHGAEPALANMGYFDRILTLNDIFAMEL